MARPKGTPDQPPTSYPNTTPAQVGTDISTWLLNSATRMEASLGKVEATVAAFQGQLTRIESKVDAVEKEVSGHGKWMHTLKVFAGLVALLLVWVFVNGVWPWLKPKIGIP